MVLEHIMERSVGSVSANDYAAEALRLMERLGRSWLFVLEGDEVASLVFARDLLGLSKDRLREGDVREYRTALGTLVNASASLLEAERLLGLSRQAFLVVLDEEKRPLGIVTADALQDARRPVLMGVG